MKRIKKLKLFILVAAMILLLLGLGFGALSPKNVGEPPPSFTGTPAIPAGIGIMGDSNSDEYRADDARGETYGATTFNWMEQLVMDRGLNFGRWGTWGEPRRTGYEYNWARSGATANSLLESGEHTGLAQQVAEGKVSLVFVWIGDNDFHSTNGTYEEIYSGALGDAAVQSKADQVVADITTAVDTVLKAGKVKMVVITITDKGLAPQALIRFPDPAKRKRVSEAISAVNAGIKELAITRGITVVDINDFARIILGRIDKLGFLEVGDQKINILIPGNDPYHLQLADHSGHAGTVMSGLFANALFIEPFNGAFGLSIPRLTDEEILRNAGIQ